jgi:hypothetical protein
MICAALEPEDVPSFRLLNRRCARIGLNYLFPNGQVDFYMSKRDLSRLDNIAEHPILRERVKTLQYEAHTLDPQRKSFKQWKESVRNEYMKSFPFRQRRPKLRLSNSMDWKSRYNIYLDMMREQDEILDQMQDLDILSRAFAKCPNLRALVFSNEYAFHNYRRIHDPFEAALQQPYCYLKDMGSRQLFMALIASTRSQAKLAKLTAGTISWKFFSYLDCLPSDLIRLACSSLTYLHLELTTGMTDDDIFGVEVAECRNHLETHGSVRSFLGRIPNLEVLNLRFDFMNEDPDGSPFDPMYPAELKDIISLGHVWPKLHTLTLGCFETLQDDLMHFLDNHKSTLKSLILIDVELGLKRIDDHIKGGSWMELLPYIRNTLQLDYGCLHGKLSACGAHAEGDEEWHVNHEDVPGEEDWREEIVNYLTRKIDVCPLREDNMCFM